jgi:Rrf2 family iron-sulfur cluster assembly transcriptional regulator
VGYGEPSEVPAILSQTALYALRAMAILSRGGVDGARVRGAELAMEGQIPSFYISKVMRELVRAGLVDGLRGHGGGFRLARAPAEIKLAEILEAAEWTEEVGVCAFGIGRCNPAEPCSLHFAWNGLQGSVLHWAHTHTLEALQTEPPRQVGPPERDVG